MSDLYIPKQITVGFQKREDCFTQKLAYIIYTDDKGVLRKEKSWKSWRDNKIPVETYENIPKSGFVLNKDVKRYNWSHFSSNRTLIRIHDDRGFELEVTTENLLGILMNSDCSKRALQGEYVYAWSGPELVLLPTNAEEYEKATTFTSLQAGKVSAKDLVPGCSYKSKRDGDYVYVGRFMWYHVDSYYSRNKTRLGKKRHIFTNDDGKNFITKSSVDFLAAKNNDEVISNYADIIEQFQKNPKSSKIISWEVKPAKIDFTTKLGSYGGFELVKKKSYFKIENDIVSDYTIEVKSEYNYANSQSGKSSYTFLGFQVAPRWHCFDINKQEFVERKSMPRIYNNYYGAKEKYDSEEEILALGLGDLYITLENGKKIKVDCLSNL